MGTTMDKTQRRIMMFLPIIFITFVAQFPMGLILYWMTTNLWTVGQGLITRRLMPKVGPGSGPSPSGTKRSSRTPRKEPQPEDETPAAETETPAPKPSNGPPRRVKRKKKARR
jgi:YidC/Oxa1 family membrane protein insertase